MIKFETTRLTIANLTIPIDEPAQERLVSLFDKDVTTHLPASFQHIDTIEKTSIWLTEQNQNSQVLGLYRNDKPQLIGLLILHKAGETIHLGYLIAKDCWRQGFASEMLDGLINFARQQNGWARLSGGVSIDNQASLALLAKKGFITQTTESNAMVHLQISL